MFVFSGFDAPMIAYDALLGGGKDWKEVVLRGMLHGKVIDHRSVYIICRHQKQ